MRWWVALVAPVWLALALCAAWEPVMWDGWDHAAWYEDHALSVDEIVELLDQNYRYANPRLGQTFTRVLYAPGPVHVIATPLLGLAVIYLLVALVLGRWPSVRRADDAQLALLVAAALFACAPQIGPLLVYRPYVGNYTFGLVLNLLWLVPYRFHAGAPAGPRWWLVPLMLALGGLAGFCNEHTGVAFLALGAAGIVAQPRAVRAWAIAGVVGLALGYWLLLGAPGQDVRYGGLAKEAGLAGRVLDRGLGGNLGILGLFVLYLLPALPLAAAGAWGRA
ncbi:MAG: hypothetical protein KIT31_38680, partial [Deltaproteobacteria bacterium]|nr:hypothetical protein [Deltaproteobacteria bacterium]